MFSFVKVKMKIALGSKMSELIACVFKEEEQSSPFQGRRAIIALSALADFMLLLQFSCSYYISTSHGVLGRENNVGMAERCKYAVPCWFKYCHDPEPVSSFLCFCTTEAGIVLLLVKDA